METIGKSPNLGATTSFCESLSAEKLLKIHDLRRSPN